MCNDPFKYVSISRQNQSICKFFVVEHRHDFDHRLCIGSTIRFAEFFFDKTQRKQQCVPFE